MGDTKWVYDFSEGSRDMRELLGGKGANVAEMTRVLGAERVPAGFTITTEACVAYMKADQEEPEGMAEQVADALERLEEQAGKKLGDNDDPLLVSVRSGARESMPGMLDTVLNLGLNDESVEGLAKQTENDRFAWDSYRRFVQMFGNVARGMPGEAFEDAIKEAKQERGVETDTDLDTDDLKALTQKFKDAYQEHTGDEFPQDPQQQLELAIRAVFDSWTGERAVSYRRLNRIPDDWGTAVNVQQMVFGNKGDSSATGVAFSRDEVTGEPEPSGRLPRQRPGRGRGLRRAQHARHRRARGRDARGARAADGDPQRAREALQGHAGHGVHDRGRAAVHAADAQRQAPRPGRRPLRVRRRRRGPAVQGGGAGHDRRRRRSTRSCTRRSTPRPTSRCWPAASAPRRARPRARSCSPPRRRWQAEQDGRDVILVRPFTEADDVAGFHAAKGILTSEGGKASHAALVARGMGRPAVVGAGSLKIDLGEKTISVNGTTVGEGDFIAIDGTKGCVTLEDVPLIDARVDEYFDRVLEWADEIRRLGVRANADDPDGAKKARELGAEGIGLCRTEHMFMAEDRQPKMRAMIMAGNEEERREALAELLPLQQEDFEGLFEAMVGLPVTIRLLDPPLHEFLQNLPDLSAEVERARIECSDDLEKLEATLKRVNEIHEENPMLGTRGCRLGILYPEIYEMQVEAIMRATAAVHERSGEAPHVEIMIPLIDYEHELELLRELVVRIGDEQGLSVGDDYTVGTMIELPRACFVANRIAEHADFFSFGTNDLTQTALGFSRDDVESKFVPVYMERKIIDRSPFETIDKPGVGWLVRLAAWVGREAHPGLKLGICGEHGGDPESIEFFHMAGLDYVSCSPYRVPIARVAAAQAAIREED